MNAVVATLAFLALILGAFMLSLSAKLEGPGTHNSRRPNGQFRKSVLIQSRCVCAICEAMSSLSTFGLTVASTAFARFPI